MRENYHISGILSEIWYISPQMHGNRFLVSIFHVRLQRVRNQTTLIFEQTTLAVSDVFDLEQCLLVHQKSNYSMDIKRFLVLFFAMQVTNRLVQPKATKNKHQQNLVLCFANLKDVMNKVVQQKATKNLLSTRYLERLFLVFQQS